MSNQLTKEEFETSLVDVRKAYRLLFLYQSRVLDTVRFISQRLGFGYRGGWAWFSDNSPKQGSGNLKSWGWDWLNMYHYEFLLAEFKSEEGEVIKFSVVLQSDTGFYDTLGNEKTQLSTFAPVEESQTRLRLLAGRNAWHGDIEEFGVTYPASSTDFFQGKTPEGGVCLTKSYPLSDFLSETTTRMVLAEFVGYCHNNGIPQIQLV